MLLSAISLLGIMISLLLRCAIWLIWVVVTSLLLSGWVGRSAPIWIIALVVMALGRRAVSLLRILLIGIMRRRWVLALSLRIRAGSLAILLVLWLLLAVALAVALALGRVVVVIAAAVALLLLLAIAMALILAVAAVVVVA